MQRPFTLLVACVALMTAACGSEDEPTRTESGAAAKPACLVTPAGNKLCGPDAKRWCEQNTDINTTNQALLGDCETVGADPYNLEMNDDEKRLENGFALTETLTEKYPEAGATVGPNLEDAGYTITLDADSGEKVPLAVNEKICRSARAALGASVEVKFLDVNAAEDFICDAR